MKTVRLRPRALFLAPHNDDETLFGAFTLLAWHPDVVVCYRSAKQKGIDPVVRERETAVALSILKGDGSFVQAEVFDTAPDDELVDHLTATLPGMHDVFGRSDQYDIVFAPAIEDGGHEQHTLVGKIARDVFGEKVVHYLTYRRGFGRSRSSTEVPFHPLWPAAKLAAMSMYRSQIELPSTAPWFVDYGIREFYAEDTKAGMYEIPAVTDHAAPELDAELLRRVL